MDLLIPIVLIIVALVVALSILSFLFRFIAVMAMAFTVAMLALPALIMFLVFIIFPPTLIVFVVGWFALIFEGDSNGVSTKKKWYQRESEEEYIRRQRRKLGYDVEDE